MTARRALSICIAAGLAAIAIPPAAHAETTISSRTARAGGMTFHYLTAGSAPETVILLHGYAQSSHM